MDANRFTHFGSFASVGWLIAFTALRLEMGWKQVSVDAAGLAKAFAVRHQTNALEETIAELVH